VYGATLWDFIIVAELEKKEIELYEKPVVFGRVLDHASNPVSDAEVAIRVFDESVTTTTDSEGKFSYEFGPKSTSGTFTVNISAKSGDKKGFTKMMLHVGNEVTTFEEIYYNSEFVNQTLSNDPYVVLKLKHYLKYLEEQNKREQKQIELESKKLDFQQKQAAAEQKLEELLKERPVGAGIIAGDKYERYLSTVNPQIKSTISAQLNFTKQIYEDAREAMKEVLDNGGSLQEARKVYFEKLAVTKEELNKFNDSNNTKNYSKIKTNEDKKINSKKVKGLTLNKYLK
jgi:hypothetical protein